MSELKSVFESKLFRAGIFILLFFLIVLVGSHIRFLFFPVGILLSTLSLPVIFAGVLFYLTKPLIFHLEKLKLPRVAAIAVLYVLFALFLVLLVLLIAPVIRHQLNSLIENTPALVREARKVIQELGENSFLHRFAPEISAFEQNLPEKLGELIKDLYSGIGRNVSAFLGFIANVLIILATVPFILFFMHKEGDKLPLALAALFPDDYREEAFAIIMDMNKTLGAYIKGQLIVSCFVGTMVFLGYLIIGLEYALLLALVALVTNLIPYIGPVIGTVPGMIVGLIDSPMTMVKVLILVVIVQQLESQLIAPLVMGKHLKIHPLTIIFLLLTAGSMAGFVGLLLAVPVYAVSKTAFIHIRKLYLLRAAAQSDKPGSMGKKA